MTKLERIIDDIAQRLALITIANGYKTDAGTNVIKEMDVLIEGEQYYLNVALGDDNTENQLSANMRLNQPFIIQAYSETPIASNVPERHKLLSDIKKCLLTYKKTCNEISNISYSTKEMVIRQGSEKYAQVNVLFNVQYLERKGDPDY